MSEKFGCGGKLFGRCSRKFNFEKENEKILKLSLSEKRDRYIFGDKYVTVDKIDLWSKLGANSQCDPDFKDVLQGHIYEPDAKLNDKIGIYFGNICTLEIDAIVTATDGAGTFHISDKVESIIHTCAGDYLGEECETIDWITFGESIITGGYNLPAKYVIHTGGISGENPQNLESCYKNSLQKAVENNLKTIAFPCLCTGIFRYPNKEAAQIALKTVRTYLESNCDAIDLIIFCLSERDKMFYFNMLPYFFPIA